MKDFEYASATTVDEAVGLLASRPQRAKVLAGGTDLLVQLREGLREADLVLDVKKIPELTELSFDPKRGLRLGAAVPCYRLYEDRTIAAAYPALADAARIIGGWQIQTRASIGGNLCNSSPAADSIPALIAHDAVCQIAGPSGRRSVKVAGFCTAPGRNVLEAGEFLVSIELPPPQPHASSRYLRFIPRNEMDIAVVGAGAWLRLNSAHDKVEEARIALAAVAPTPVEAVEAAAWLAGKPATDESFAEAGDRARLVAKPITDMRGPADYRVHLIGVLTRRALATAAERAGRPA
ncbi:MAG: xanthine dehydrogenase family protein subunit M [Pirellulales bacterium]